MNQLENIIFGLRSHSITAFFALITSVLTFFIFPYLNSGLYLVLLFAINSLIVYTMVKAKMGLLPCSRYLFLVAPGVLQCLFWHLSGQSVSVALLGNDYLNSSVVDFVASISTLGAASANLGFLITPMIIKSEIKPPKINSFHIQLIFILFIFISIYYGLTIGGSLLDTGGYVSDGQGTVSSAIGTLNVFYFYFFSIFFLYKYWNENYSNQEAWVYGVISFFAVAFIALRGVRQDSIGFLLAVFAIILARRRYKKGKPLYFLVLKLFFLSWLGSIFSGLIRENFTIGYLLVILQNPLIYFVSIMNGYVVFNMNTASMIIGTLNVIPYKLVDTGFLYGQSFLDWIPRTLPEFLYPNRPVGPEFEMYYNNEWFGWGGIHEIAEEYWNFGIVGVLVIPFIISYILNSAGRSLIRSRTFFSAIPIVWLIMLPRWTWYQVFALYKATLTMFMLGVLLYAMALITAIKSKSTA